MSLREEGLLVCPDDDSGNLGLEGESGNVGDAFGPVKDILLTIDLTLLGEDQFRSLLPRPDIANRELVGVEGKGDFGLE